MERGVFHFGMQDDGKALRNFEQAIRLGSRSAVVHLFKAMIHMKRGEGEPAIAEFNVAITIDPSASMPISGWPRFICSARIIARRWRSLTGRSRSTPRAPLLTGLARNYFVSAGKPEKALEDLDEAVRLDPRSGHHLRRSARVCFEKGDFNRALSDLDAAIKIDPADPEAEQGRAWILATCHDPRIRNGEQAVISATRPAS